MAPLLDMSGKVALVTGAAGSVGGATARKLAEAGANLVLVDIAADPLTATGRELAALGIEAHVHVADLSRAEDCEPAIHAAGDKFGRLDALCNVAGVMAADNTHSMSPDDFNKIVAVNMTAPFLLIRAAIPMLLESQGAVVNVASATGLYPAPYLAAYGASKAALIYMTKSMAAEYMDRAIRFNAVAPGGMMTNIVASMANFTDADPAIMQRNGLPRGLVQVEDVAATTAYLANDAARGYHGACIVLDAGMSL
jgi:NAD(P)-dependent dehydrogenase (short-subunit alcohol dehydrogenase family)